MTQLGKRNVVYTGGLTYSVIRGQHGGQNINVIG